MASLKRGVSFRRQGSSGRSWADNLVLGGEQQPRYTNRQSKGDGITKKTIMVPDSGDDGSKMMNNHNRGNSSPREDRRKSRPGGVLSWLKNRFRKTRS